MSGRLLGAAVGCVAGYLLVTAREVLRGRPPQSAQQQRPTNELHPTWRAVAAQADLRRAMLALGEYRALEPGAYHAAGENMNALLELAALSAQAPRDRHCLTYDYKAFVYRQRVGEALSTMLTAAEPRKVFEKLPPQNEKELQDPRKRNEFLRMPSGALVHDQLVSAATEVWELAVTYYTSVANAQWPKPANVTS